MVSALGVKLLTPREEQVVALVADGLSNRKVGKELCLSEHTIKKYLVPNFRQAGNFQSRGAGALGSKPWRQTAGRVGGGTVGT